MGGAIIIIILILLGFVMHFVADHLSKESSKKVYLGQVERSYKALKNFILDKSRSFDDQDVNDHFFERIIFLSKHGDLVEEMRRRYEGQSVFIERNTPSGIFPPDNKVSAYIENLRINDSYMVDFYKASYSYENHKFDFFKDLLCHFILEKGFTGDLVSLKEALIRDCKQFFIEKDGYKRYHLSSGQKLRFDMIIKVIYLMEEKDLAKEFSLRLKS